MVWLLGSGTSMRSVVVSVDSRLMGVVLPVRCRVMTVLRVCISLSLFSLFSLSLSHLSVLCLSVCLSLFDLSFSCSFIFVSHSPSLFFLTSLPLSPLFPLSVWGQCNHHFHMHCILKWVNSSNNGPGQCPMCRQPWKFKGDE